MRRWLSERIAHLADCPTASVVAVCALGIGSGLIEYVTHTLVMRGGVHGRIYAVFEASVIGAVAALIGALVLVGMHERRRRELEHIRSVAELNHHVRNALQIIVESRYLPEPRQTEAVLASVDRIDRTLSLLFPMEHGASHLNGHSHAKRPQAGPRAEAA